MGAAPPEKVSAAIPKACVLRSRAQVFSARSYERQVRGDGQGCIPRKSKQTQIFRMRSHRERRASLPKNADDLSTAVVTVLGAPETVVVTLERGKRKRHDLV